MINDEFPIGIAKLLAGESFTIPSHLAFGSTSFTPASGDTYLPGEFDRNAVSVSRVSNQVKFVGSRTSSENNNETLYNTALVNSSVLASSNNIMADNVFASLLLTTDFDTEIEYWFTILSE